MVAIIVAAVSCVPAAADPHPRGGFSVRFEPSAATAGQPFTTADGWTLTIKKTAIHVHALAQSGDFKATPPMIVTSALDDRLLSPTNDCELALRSLDVGDAVVKAGLEIDGSDPPPGAPCGVDPEMAARFEGAADSQIGLAFGQAIGGFPNVGVVLDAEKNGRRIHLELFIAALVPDSMLHGKLVITSVKANDGVTIRFPAQFESIFVADGRDPPPIPFDDIADADADGDGNVTGAELDARSLLFQLSERFSYVTVDPKAPYIPDPTQGADSRLEFDEN
jgi:hypothetical protein